MRDKNVDANVITYNSVLSACDRAGRADDALEIFELMRREGIKPDKHSYAAVIGACATGGRLDDAMATYRAGCRAVDPDPALYAAAMQACAAPGSAHAGDAAGIWRDMREKLPTEPPGRPPRLCGSRRIWRLSTDARRHRRYAGVTTSRR